MRRRVSRAQRERRWAQTVRQVRQQTCDRRSIRFDDRHPQAGTGASGGGSRQACGRCWPSNAIAPVRRSGMREETCGTGAGCAGAGAAPGGSHRTPWSTAPDVEDNPSVLQAKAVYPRCLDRRAAQRGGGAGDRLRGGAQRAAGPARPGGAGVDDRDPAQLRCGWTPISRKSSCGICASDSRPRCAAICTAVRSSITATCRACRRAPARRSHCCRHRMPPATGSRWYSAFRCGFRIDDADLAKSPLRVGPVGDRSPSTRPTASGAVLAMPRSSDHPDRRHPGLFAGPGEGERGSGCGRAAAISRSRE